MNNEKITIIGAGLAGSLLSIFLAKRGFKLDLFERRPDMRKEKISAGRSINMALSTRGIYALKQVGLADEILKMAIPMQGRMVHALDGQLTLVPYGQYEHEVIYSISRADLNMTLMDAAEKLPGVRFYFKQKCTGMDFDKGELQLHNESTDSSVTIQANRVIATDGSGSAIRTDMLKLPRVNFTQAYLDHGYKELMIPAGANGQFQLEKNALHIWPRAKYMLIALPNPDGSFTCTLFFPFEGEDSFEKLTEESKVHDFFQKQFPDAVALMPTLLEDFFSNPTGALVTVKCHPWHIGDKVMLLGDAAHAIVPFYGQGMNCAFEDCTYLDECLEKHGSNWAEVFKELETIRKPNADAIAELALENYIEMRDHVADPKFPLKRELEFALERKYPTLFIPKYSMVTFHRIPYAVAHVRSKIQEKILADLTQAIERMEDADWEKAERLIHAELTELTDV